ncbi:MAG: hypothetical protein CME68_08450 [Halobacteriovoraceae bacterium]|nr:hypothetical protein [Halobacteriovoraceae bacterium]
MIWYDTIEQNNLTLHLKPISIRDLFYFQYSPATIFYVNKEKVFQEVYKKNSPINREALSFIIKKTDGNIFIDSSDYEEVINLQQGNLRKTIRSISMSKSLKNIKKLINLLSLNLKYLYQNPQSDNQLNLQYQSIISTFNLIIENEDVIPFLFQEIYKQKHYYIITQPFISSLNLLSFLLKQKFYNKKEMENLFVTSYFKDIGMSSIPFENYEGLIQTEREKKLFSNHPNVSVKYLFGRLPLNLNNLNIIKHHHSYHSLVNKDLREIKNQNNESIILGFETLLVSVMDIIAGMTSNRPFRETKSLFESLIVIKKVMIKDYPKEFTILVNFFKRFFAKK